jgi:hypothetical protein
VESRKAGMTAEMYQQAMVLARAKPIQSAVQSYVANGNWDQAEAIMADPEVNKLLDPSVARPLRIDIAVGRGKEAKEKREIETNVRQWEAVTGAKIDPSKYAELPDFKSSTAAQKIAQNYFLFSFDNFFYQKN